MVGMEKLRLRCGYYLFVFMGLIMVETQGSGKFTILLVNYKNPDHKLFNGECCDTPSFCSLSACDNYFRFCAVMLGSIEQCSLGGLLSTKVMGTDSFTFANDLGGGLKNPITYSYNEWKGASVVIEVWDDDGGHLIGRLDDFVDKYTLVVTETPAKNKASSSPTDKKLCGKRSCTNVKVQVYCDDKYLIPQCTEYCESRDSDVEGHYTCDYDRGRKVCLDGWYDAGSNCTKKKKECNPRNDTAGHYDCDSESGEKICLTGWMGTNCTQVYVPPSLRPTSTPHQTQTAHVHQTTTWTRTPTANTAGHITDTACTTTTLTSQNAVKTNSLNLRTTSRVQVTASTITISRQSSKATEQVHTTSSTASSVASSSKQIHPSNTQLKDSTTVAVHQTTTATLTSVTLETKTTVVNKPDTVSTTLAPTSASRDSPTHASTVRPTTIGPTTDHVVVINVSPSKNWTKEKEDKLKKIIKDQIIEFCKKQPQSCNINPNMTLNSTSLFNKTEVIIDTRNGSTGNDVLVFVKVKLPTKIPGLSGGILVPSIVIKEVIKSSKETFEKQTGLKVSLDNNTTITMATTPSRPLTAGPSVILKSTPPGSIIPGLVDYWAVIICAVAATLLLLIITLCFAYHANRSNKVHPLKVVPKTKVKSFSPHKDNQELISLTRIQHVPANKNISKIQTKDTGLRSRTSSINTDNRYPDSPFAPDFIDF